MNAKADWSRRRQKGKTLEFAAHPANPALDAATVRLEPVVKAGAGAVLGFLAQHGMDCLWTQGTPRPAAVLRWTATVISHTARERFARLGFRPVLLDPDPVPLRDVQVVLVREPGTTARLQRHQGHIRRGGRHFPTTVTTRAEAETVQVDALPSHRDLDHAVRFAQAAGTSRRRHTIGLTPSSQTLTCMTPTAFGIGSSVSRSATDFRLLGGRGTSEPRRANPYPVAGTTLPRGPLTGAPFLVPQAAPVASYRGTSRKIRLRR